jgi:hypothetical protein
MANDIFNENEPAIKSATTPAVSGFQKALPYIALAAPAIASLQKTGKVGPGLKIGSQLLSGFSAIKGMQRAEAQEKDRATKSAIEIKDLRARDEFLETKGNPKLDRIYLSAEPEQKEYLDKRMAPYLDESGRMTNRTKGLLRQEFINDAVALDTYLKMGSTAKDQRAAKLFEEAELNYLRKLRI